MKLDLASSSKVPVQRPRFWNGHKHSPFLIARGHEQRPSPSWRCLRRCGLSRNGVYQKESTISFQAAVKYVRGFDKLASY